MGDTEARRCEKGQALVEVELECLYMLVLAASLEPCLLLSSINMISFCVYVFVFSVL